MNAYVYQAALYCEPCGVAIRTELNVLWPTPDTPQDEYDSDDYPKGPYADGGGESDSPEHCDSCGAFLRNPLTSDGYAYVRELIAKDTRKPTVLDDWKEFYGIEVAR